jgi:mannose-6-phosphate isomerase-like protein (cupin superfamily)
MSVVGGDSLNFQDLPGRLSADPFADLDSESSVRLVKLGRTKGRMAHRHPHSEEVLYIRSGSGSVWIDGTLHPVKSGDIVRIPAGAAHATVPDEGIEMELVCFFPHPVLAENIEQTQIEVT